MSLFRPLRLPILLLALCLPLQAAEETAVDAGVLLRAATLHAQADLASASLAELAAGTSVSVMERQGLWLRVHASGEATPARGWLRLTAVRLTGRPAETSGSVGGGLARLSRSVSSLFGGLRGRETRTAHATIGIRGLTPAELETAQADPAALDFVAAQGAGPAQAEAFASAGGLVARAAPDVAP